MNDDLQKDNDSLRGKVAMHEQQIRHREETIETAIRARSAASAHTVKATISELDQVISTVEDQRSRQVDVMTQVNELMDQVQLKHAHVIAAAGAIALREQELRAQEKQLFVERSRARIGGFLAAHGGGNTGIIGNNQPNPSHGLPPGLAHHPGMGELVRHDGDAYGLRELIRSPNSPNSPTPILSANPSLLNLHPKTASSTATTTSVPPSNQQQVLRHTPSAAALRALSLGVFDDPSDDEYDGELRAEREVLKAKQIAFAKRKQHQAQQAALQRGILHTHRPNPSPSSAQQSSSSSQANVLVSVSVAPSSSLSVQTPLGSPNT